MDPQLSGKHWLIESWYKSAVPWASVGVWVCTLRVVICIVICIPSGFALGNTYNYTQGTNPIHPRSPWYNYYMYVCNVYVCNVYVCMHVCISLNHTRDAHRTI